MKPSGDRYQSIYVDTGGTFTDSLALRPDGSFIAGKASTTPDDLMVCFFDSIRTIAKTEGKSLEQLIAETDEIGYGTTAGTNMVVQGLPGPKLGVITTKSIEDRIFTWRLRVAGIPLTEAMHMINSGHPRQLISRLRVKGINERMDCKGKVVLPLSEPEVRKEVKELIDEGVEGIAVCFMWSFLNGSHEARVKEVIKEMKPEILVALSSDIAPVVREYPRFMSTIIDLYIGKELKRLLMEIENRLGSYGYRRPLLVMQAAGGVSQSKTVHPGTTLHSGPVGGLMAVDFLKKLYKHDNAIGSDVGGTSFDICISPAKSEALLREAVVGRYETATPMREIVTIGAGGGTIAWVDNIRPIIHVGPHSAGAVPGPACYCRGGSEPTVTDADVVLNRVNPEWFLGGTMRIDKELAARSIDEKIAKPLNLNVIEAAEGICSIIDSKMKVALRGMIATKGLNPADFLLFAYGGMGPTHCCGYAQDLGFRKVIVSPFSAVMCAFGGAISDIQHRYEASALIAWPNLPFHVVSQKFELDSLDRIPGWTIERLNSLFGELEDRAYGEASAEGFRKDQVHLSYEILGRYGGQLWENRCRIPLGRVRSVDDARGILRAFEEEYEALYSKGAMAPRGGLEIITVGLAARIPTAKPRIVEYQNTGSDASGAIKERRKVRFDRQWVDANIYDMDLLRAGNLFSGPAVVEGRHTTLVVSPEWRLTVDEYLNMALEQKG